MVLARLVFDYALPWDWVPLVLSVLLTLVRGPGAAKTPRGRTSAGPETTSGEGADGARLPVEVESPVRGRWVALNSPADKTPSHGTHAYGQTFAIDIVADPEEGGQQRPAFGWWPLSRGNGDFPAFGAPVLAVGDATVVHASDHRRDHRSRNSYPALLYLVFEALFRELGGPGQIVGNHVVLDLGDGRYALYAHLRRGSLAVREGERVTAGQLLARCGNSGNSTEPHVHFQLMDHHDLEAASGLPFTWRGIGVPANGAHFTEAPRTSADAGGQA
nr:M23 family metallopeptidase [Streptomyces sp. HNM0574]